MTDIYLVDYLGVHCGMHYYLEAFKRELANIPDTSIKILSNYTDSGDEQPFFLNQYKGSKVKKVFSLMCNLLRLKKFVNRHPNSLYIYLTYGNSIDLPFMKIISEAKHHIIDIHEAIAQNVDANKGLKSKFKSLYRDKIKTAISHSTRTDDFLNEYGYCGTRLTVPHFKYVFPKEYDLENIPYEIKRAPESNKINLLFFGNLNESKGVDVLLDAINMLPDQIANRINVIIAGKDFDGAVDRVTLKDDRNAKIFRRHISDDELRYLYQNVDYLCLPYRKTSQSGILEMAFYFKKPIIASDVTYFRNTLAEFPTFGILSGNDSKTYAQTITQVINRHGNYQYYSKDDYDKYENRGEVKNFIVDLQKLIHSWI